MIMHVVFLLSVLSIAAASIRVRNDSYMNSREEPVVKKHAQKELRGSTHSQVTAHATKGPVGTQLGDFVVISNYKGSGICGANVMGTEIYKVGECIPFVDSDGKPFYYKMNCYLDTGSILGAAYSDPDCAGPMLYKGRALRSGECVGAFLGTCLNPLDFRFMSRTVSDEIFLFHYRAANLNDAVANNFTAITYADTSANWRWGGVYNLRDGARAKCSYPFPSLENCVDTRETKSFSLVPGGINEAKLNLYSQFNGAGEVTSFDTTTSPVQCDDFSGSWCVYRYLFTNWFF
eukprot:gene35519-43062_t